MRLAILVGLALMAPFPASVFGQQTDHSEQSPPEQLRHKLPASPFGQETDRAGHLYFTKVYRGADPLPQIVTVTGVRSGLEFAATARTSAGGEWLSTAPGLECCTTPAPLMVSVKPDLELAPGDYSGQVVLAGTAGPQVIDVDLIVTRPRVPAFDRTPSQLSFSIPAGGEVLPQMMQIGSVGQESFSWRVIPSAEFLQVSADSGTGSTRISVGIVRDKLPGEGRTSGIYTGQLLFVSAGSTTTIPVTVAVGDTDLRLPQRLKAMKAAGTLTSSPTVGATNLWPANTANCFCGHFDSQDTLYGGNGLAPDGTLSAKQIGGYNSGGAVPHMQLRYQELGAGPWTISFHLRADVLHWAYITASVNGVIHNAWFNLDNGTASTIPSGWTVQISAPLGNGWYRYAVSFTAISSAGRIGFGLATADQELNYIATNGQGIFEWGQQAEAGLVLTTYSANEVPCMNTTVQRGGTPVPAGTPISFTISTTNQATPVNATTLSAPLPAGSGVNWTINPAFVGLGNCGITGAVGSQTLGCDFGSLGAGIGASVRILSATTASSCGVYSVTASVTGGGSHFQSTDAITVTCQSAAVLQTPTPGSTLPASATFTWNAVVGADQYWLDVGNTVAVGDIWAGAIATTTSQVVSGLPCDGRTIYVQLYTHLNGAWLTPQRYTYTAPTGCTATSAQIASPTPGTVLTGTAITFTWGAASGADQYWLDVGNSVGSGDISAGALTATSKMVSGLPCDGRTLYAQLYTHTNGAWLTPQRYTYTAPSGCTIAQIASPTPGTVLSGTTVNFTWGAASGADQYWLDVGNSVGSGDISAGALTATTKQVSGLPCDGRTIYVQLYTHRNSAWQTPQRYTYTAPSGCAVAQITSPTPGSVLAGNSITFGWASVAGADQYWLDVGNSIAVGDISAGALAGTSKVVGGLPCDGRTVFVQLYTHINGVWQSPQRYTYTAKTGCN